MKKTDKIITIAIIVILVVIFLAMLGGNRRKDTFSSSEKIGLLELKGVIIESDAFYDRLLKFRKNDNIKAILVRINSPGGGVAASHELYAAIKQAALEKPVVAYISGTGASGGYYAALGATKIIANPASVTGSIGVIVSIPGFSELFEKIGIDNSTIKSGKFKDSGSPYRKMTAEDSLYFQNVVNVLYDQFLDVIENEREISKNDLKKIADGRIFTGCQAFEYGLVDSIGTFENAVNLTAELAGITETPNVIRAQKRKVSLIDLMFSDIEEILQIITRYPVINYF